MGRHHGHTRSKTRDVISLIFSFFLSIAVVGITALIIARVGILSQSSVVSVMDDAFYEKVLKFANDKAHYYTLPTGIDPSVLDGVFTINDVRRDAKESVAASFAGVDHAPRAEDAKQRLTQNVRERLAQDGMEGAEAEKIVTSYVDEIMDIYAKSVTVVGIDAMGHIDTIFDKYFPIALIVFLAFAALMLFFIVRLHHFVHRSMRYVAYAFGGAALMCFVIPLIVYISGFYKGLSVEPEYFYYLCISFISHVLRLFMLGSAVLFACTIATIVLSARMRKKAMRHKGFNADF